MFEQIKALLSAVGSEKSTVIPITDENELKKIINEDYSEAFNNFKSANTIFRGSKKYTQNCLAVKYSPGIRVSQNTSNIYTKLLSDIFPSWSKFPKRNRSIIASFNSNIAKFYGNDVNKELYIVFPKNGTKIAICPGNDIWFSFSDNGSFDDLTYFNDEFIKTASDVLNISSNEIKEAFSSVSNAKALTILDSLDKEFLEMCKINKIYNNLLNDYYQEWKKDNELYYSDYLEKIFFNNSGFQIKTVSEIQTNGRSEIWFEGTALFLPMDSFLEEFYKIKLF